ncbi:hypothetical protein EDB84DRAFT_1674858 [Lactarius hengduanensis]|nr:hypothetical protein EDB84DRAFT_1674858 [Lactarius hengduanensis]
MSGAIWSRLPPANIVFESELSFYPTAWRLSSTFHPGGPNGLCFVENARGDTTPTTADLLTWSVAFHASSGDSRSLSLLEYWQGKSPLQRDMSPLVSFGCPPKFCRAGSRIAGQATHAPLLRAFNVLIITVTHNHPNEVQLSRRITTMPFPPWLNTSAGSSANCFSYSTPCFPYPGPLRLGLENDVQSSDAILTILDNCDQWEAPTRRNSGLTFIDECCDGTQLAQPLSRPQVDAPGLAVTIIELSLPENWSCRPQSLPSHLNCHRPMPEKGSRSQIPGYLLDTMRGVEIARLVIRRKDGTTQAQKKEPQWNDKFLGPRAERQSLGGNKGSAVYSTPTIIELESQSKDINNFLTSRNVDATQKTCRFQEVDNLVHLGLRCESKQQLYAIRSAAFVWGRQTPSKFGSSSLRLLRRMSGHKEDWPGTLNGCTRRIILPVQSYIGRLLLTSTGKPPEQHTDSPRVHQFLLIESSFTNSSPSQGTSITARH